MRIAITGSSGLVGSELVQYFRRNGHTVSRIMRLGSKLPGGEKVIHWDIDRRQIDKPALEGMDAIIHLAGANIAGERWDTDYKRLIYSSRIDSTALITATIKQLEAKPKVFFSASAVGFYGAAEPEVTLTEDSAPGSDFLARVCKDWEKTASDAEGHTRIVYMRFGTILSQDGGALTKMLPIFSMGLGGKLGNGKQMMSYIALKEIPNILEYILSNDSISGPVNFVTPQPVSNAEFTKALGRVIQRPTIFPVPSFGVRMMFGEMGDALLLSGAKVMPQRLAHSQYAFQYPTVEAALRASIKND